MSRYHQYLCLALISDLQLGTISVYAQPQSDVKLVLQITVDGLRADLLNRYQSNFT